MRYAAFLALNALTALPALAGAGSPVATQQPAAWLGVSYDVRWIEAGGSCESQLLVQAVVPGSPAARAGVRAGDLVFAIDGEGLPPTRLAALAARLAPGDSVRLAIRRDGSTRRVIAVAERRPDSPRRLVRPAEPSAGGPIIEVRGDTVLARNVPATPRVGGYWLMEGDGRTTFRPLQTTPTSELERRVAALIACAAPESRVVAGLRADLEGLHERAESLRVVIARRALERPGDDSRIVVFRHLVPGATTPGAPDLGRLRAEATMGALFRGFAGAELVAMEPELAAYFRGADAGLLVVRVAPGTPGQRAGLRPGDVVTAAAGQRVSSLAELRGLVAASPGDAVDLTVIRQGRRRSVTLPRP